MNAGSASRLLTTQMVNKLQTMYSLLGLGFSGYKIARYLQKFKLMAGTLKQY